jgi:hypothetical protein
VASEGLCHRLYEHVLEVVVAKVHQLTESFVEQIELHRSFLGQKFKPMLMFAKIDISRLHFIGHTQEICGKWK